MQKRIKRILGSAVLILTLVAAVGCGKSPAEQGGQNNKDVNESKTLTVVGSDSMQNLTEHLAEEFEALNSGVTIEVQGGGSGASFEPLRNGIAQLGLVSRELKDTEQDVTATTIARDGIGIVVNNNNPVKELSREQIAKIYAGEITNWKEVGGNDAKIVVISREAGSGTTGAFEEIVMKTIGKEIAANVMRMSQSEGIRATVAKDVNAIGFFSLYIVDDSVHALVVEGAEPTFENIINGSYKVQRPFNFTFLGTEPQDALAKAFLEFTLSEKGQEIVSENGLVTIK